MSYGFQKGRYFNFNGTQVPNNKAQSKLGEACQAAFGYIKIPEVQINAAISFGAAAIDPNIYVVGASLLNNFALMPALQDSFSKLNPNILTGESNLCLDTEPDPATQGSHLELAKKLRNWHGGLAAFFGGSAVVLQIAESMPLEYSLGLGSMVTLPTLANAYRFNKVVQGEWRITDTPKQEVSETVQAPVLAFTA